MWDACSVFACTDIQTDGTENNELLHHTVNAQGNNMRFSFNNTAWMVLTAMPLQYRLMWWGHSTVSLHPARYILGYFEDDLPRLSLTFSKTSLNLIKLQPSFNRNLNSSFMDRKPKQITCHETL